MQLFPEFCPQFAILNAAAASCARTTSSWPSSDELLSRARGQVVFEPLRYRPRTELFEQLHQRRIVIQIVAGSEKNRERNVPSENASRNRDEVLLLGRAIRISNAANFAADRTNMQIDDGDLSRSSPFLLAKFLNILFQLQLPIRIQSKTGGTEGTPGIIIICLWRFAKS